MLLDNSITALQERSRLCEYPHFQINPDLLFPLIRVQIEEKLSLIPGIYFVREVPRGFCFKRQTEGILEELVFRGRHQ